MATNEEIEFALNEHRLLVLLEDTDKGVFEQVALNAEQFKKVSDAICVNIRADASLKPGFEMAEMHVKPEWSAPSDTFLGLQSIYSDEEMS